jgi:hypothetical protein
MTGNQTTFGFARSRIELGRIIGPKKILLSGETLFSLEPKKYYLDYENPDEQLIDGLFCSFCFKGNLQLTKVIPLVEGDRHWGNSYVYNCIFCQATFLGTITWK